MSEKLYDYDPAEALDSAEAIEVFMADAMETGDTAYAAKAECVVEQVRQRLAGGHGRGWTVAHRDALPTFEEAKAE